jgi:hypothetical protein
MVSYIRQMRQFLFMKLLFLHVEMTALQMIYCGQTTVKNIVLQHPTALCKRGPLSLVSTTEELLDRKVVAPV